MPPSGSSRKKSRPSVPASDSDSDQSQPGHHKFEVDSRYLNQPVNPTTADTKVRQLIGDFKITKADLLKVVASLTSAATDIATVQQAVSQERDFDDDHIPDNPVSGWAG